MTEYTLIRSRRKTVAIYITREGAAEVRAPIKMPKTEIDRFVASKAAWIESHTAICRRRQEEKAAFKPDYGDTVSLCGQSFPIQSREGNLAGFDGESFYMPPGLPPEQVKSEIVSIYKELAKNILAKRTKECAKRMGVSPSAVKINSAKTRWGSCSGRNSINFSWRLVMADKAVIDYVVVHELAHITEHNHSPRFWAVVESVLPDYRERRQALKALQQRLASENWE